jgi:hypothetical protein
MLLKKPKVRANVVGSAKCHAGGRGSHRRQGKSGSEAQERCASGDKLRVAPCLEAEQKVADFSPGAQPPKSVIPASA